MKKVFEVIGNMAKSIADSIHYNRLTFFEKASKAKTVKNKKIELDKLKNYNRHLSKQSNKDNLS